VERLVKKRSLARAKVEADKGVVEQLEARRARYAAGACWHEPR
jgi:hypothetical protein